MKTYYPCQLLAKTLCCTLLCLSLTRASAQNTPVRPLTKPLVASNATAPQGVIAFRAAATYISGEPVASNSEKKVDFTGTYFDESRNFSVATGEFIAPADGIYHFDVRVFWSQFSAPGMVTVLIRTNLYQQIAMSSVQISSTTQPFDSNYSTLLKLKSGDKVSVYLQQGSNAQQQFKQVVFSGFKVN